MTASAIRAGNATMFRFALHCTLLHSYVCLKQTNVFIAQHVVLYNLP
jgi:hypothetical protein